MRWKSAKKGKGRGERKPSGGRGTREMEKNPESELGWHGPCLSDGKEEIRKKKSHQRDGGRKRKRSNSDQTWTVLTNRKNLIPRKVSKEKKVLKGKREKPPANAKRKPETKDRREDRPEKALNRKCVDNLGEQKTKEKNGGEKLVDMFEGRTGALRLRPRRKKRGREAGFNR